MVCWDNGSPRPWVPTPFNVRSRVHEYGGSAFAVHEQTLWFVDDGSGQVFETTATGPCRAITQPGVWRLADLCFDPRQNRLVAVGERHAEGLLEPENAIVSVDLSTGAITPLLQGHEFFAAPRVCPQAQRLAYLAWDHPHMPWDAAALYVAELDANGLAGAPIHIAGDESASAFGPVWSPAGQLAFAWESTGAWNLYAWRPGREIATLTSGNAEFALPLWQLGMSTFGWLDESSLATALTRQGCWHVARVEVATGKMDVLTSDLPSISHLHAQHGRIVAVAAAPDLPQGVVEITLDGRHQVLQPSLVLDEQVKACVSHPQAISFATTPEQTAHAFFYPPFHAHHIGPEAQKPPLIVLVHGGPTAATSPAFNANIQFWTTRGFAVLDLNYRGSTGYGRSYRSLLDGAWGVADVQDCVAGAQHAARLGWVDGQRMAIRGSSAGGFTTLAALAFRDVFAAGASLYGVGDLEALVQDTHKFEAHYLDRLIGPYPACVEIYRARSPLHSVHKLNKPLIFFQGLEDKVVPPNQTEAMVEALRARNVPVQYLAFEGEQHGFRKAETITRVYQAELAFYGQVFGFTPAP